MLDAVKYDFVDGGIVKTSVGKCFPIPEQDCFANDITLYLNRVLPLDGKWRAVLLNPAREWYDKLSGIFKRHVPQMIELQWCDKSGRVVFVVEMVEDIHTILDVPYSKWAEDCLEAYTQTHGLIKAVGVHDDQMLRGDQQQQRPDVLPAL